MKILLVGGAGFIGSKIASKLVDHEVSIFDGFYNFAKNGDLASVKEIRKPLLKNAKIFNGDIRDRVRFKEVLDITKPEIVIFLAAIALHDPRPEYYDDIFNINLHGTFHSFKEIAKCDSVERVIFASSSMVYGDFKNNGVAFEGDRLDSKGYYGICKASGELFVKDIMENAGKEWIIIRPTAVYGPGDCNNRVVKKLLTRIKDNKDVWVVDGEKLDFTYVDDIARGFVLAVTTQDSNFICNVSAGNSRLVHDVAKIIKKLTNSTSEIEVRQKMEDGRPTRGTMDVSFAKEKLNYQAQYTIEQGLEEYINKELNDHTHNISSIY